MQLLYSFSLDKNLAQPTYPCITEIFSRMNFHLCSKDHHRLYVIINTGQKIHGIKISPMTISTRGKKRQKFSQGEYFWLYSSIIAIVEYWTLTVPGIRCEW